LNSDLLSKPQHHTSRRLDASRLHLLLSNKAGAPLLVDALAPLDISSLLLRTKVTSRQQVERIFLLVHGAVSEEERDTSDERDDGHTSVIPDQVGVGGKRSESLGEGGREGGGEELDGLDERPHVFGRLGEGVLEGGDGSEDLGNGDEDVDTGDSPDGEGGLVVGILVLVVAGGLVDVVLKNGSPDHGEGSEDKTSGDLLDGGEADTALAEEGVDEGVHDGHLDLSVYALKYARSEVLTMIMMAMGSKLERMSLGTPPSCMVAHIWVRLESI
jgi:hypothetical protein